MNMRKQVVPTLVALIIVAGFLSWIGYRFTTNKRVIIPSDYSGSSIAIVFNVKGGQKIDWSYDGYRFIIPPDGILQVSNQEIDMNGSIIMTNDGKPIWNDGPIESEVMISACSEEFGRETLFIYRTNHVTLDSVIHEFTRQFDPCLE